MPDNSTSQKVLEIVKSRGPVIPSQVSTEIGTSSLLASAILSELVSNKQLRISSVKVGGTPLYYAPGQEDRLQGYTKYLHEKEKKAFDLLKSETVLRDSFLDPVTRVAVRSIRDFAVPLHVQTPDGQVELFWKWYLIGNDEAEPKIRYLFEGRGEAKVKPDGEKQGTLASKKPEAKRQGVASSDFMKGVDAYFADVGIEVIERLGAKRVVAEFIISVPSPVGSIRYYCMAKGKKSCNEGDLSTAYVRGQSRKLPVLFITTGKLTKKASQMLGQEFSSVNVKQI